MFKIETGYKYKQPNFYIKKEISPTSFVNSLFRFNNVEKPIFELTSSSAKNDVPPNEPIEVVPVIAGETPFGEKTIKNLYKTPKETTPFVLQIAQEHLGMQEVLSKEYEKLTDENKARTQMHFIEEYGKVNDQWCAHAVSHILEEAGVDIKGHKIRVAEFVEQANNDRTFRGIKTNTITNAITLEKLDNERSFRKEQIEKQFANMKPGDLIVWRSDYIAKLSDNKLDKVSRASHIGIIEGINEKGEVVVIEGNANEFVKDENAERYIVKTKEEGRYGNQSIGDYIEEDLRDGLKRKTYTAYDLASFGYYGYIDMQKAISEVKK